MFWDKMFKSKKEAEKQLSSFHREEKEKLKEKEDKEQMENWREEDESDRD